MGTEVNDAASASAINTTSNVRDSEGPIGAVRTMARESDNTEAVGTKPKELILPSAFEGRISVICMWPAERIWMAPYPIREAELFEFSKTFIGGYKRENFITLEQWVAESCEDDDKDLLMQMDIEGFEYEVFSCVSDELLNRFRIIVIEFHNLDILDKTKPRIFKKLLNTHSCLHLHPNNCCGPVKVFNLEIPKVMEFTFLRKDRIESASYRNDFPHSLDSDNISAPALPLPPCWYHHE